MSNNFNMFGKPNSVKDYVKLKEFYISKHIIFRTIVIIVTLLFFVRQYVIPYLEGRLWIPTIVINTPKYHTYTGTAKVVSDDGNTIYVGNLDDGDVTGFGELFEHDTLMYEGSFSDNKFSGSGKLYYSNGNIKYQGLFSDNHYENGTLYFENGTVLYEGVFNNSNYAEGKLYFENGILCYDGTFDGVYYKEGKLYFETGGLFYEGVFDGGRYREGRLYYENGYLCYEGLFDGGLYREGNLYFENGGLRYTGAFLNGMYNGFGKEYQNGQILYEGLFTDNLYNGDGKLYNNGLILYEGEFESGLYKGYGELYFESGGRLQYAGNFFDGLYSGQGVLYNRQGRDIYNGDFYKGEIDYVSHINDNIENTREAFGEERQILMLENSFLLLYDHMDLMFEFSFADQGDNPVLQKIKFLGEQTLSGVKKGMSVDEFKNLFETDIFTEYFFEVNEEDEVSFDAANHFLIQGDIAYCVKYNLEDIYIRAFFDDEIGEIIYYEIGGV